MKAEAEANEKDRQSKSSPKGARLKAVEPEKVLPTLRLLIDEFYKHDAHPAIINFTSTGSNTLTYAALADQIRKVAAGFEEQGLKNGTSVIFFAANSPSWIICALAAVYSGLVAVPVDPQQSEEVLKHIIDDSKAKWIFTDAKGAEKIHAAVPRRKLSVFRTDLDEGAESWTHIRSKKDNFEELLETKEVPASDTAILFYTSGTTGMPKGVPLSHTNIRSQLDSAFGEIDFLKPGDRVLLPLPLFHVYPLNTGLLGPLKMGLPVILPQSLTGPELIRAINEGGATVLVAVPRIMRSLYQALDKKIHANKFVGSIFDTLLWLSQGADKYLGLRLGKPLFRPVRKQFGPTLKLFTSGGAPLEPEMAWKFRALGWDIAVGYGLTETAPLLTMRMPGNRDIQSAGKPIPGVEVKIIPLDNKDEEDSAQKENKDEGEVVARGPNIFDGYLNLPEKTKEAFTKDGWFRTGDLGFMKNGNLHIVGRASSTLVMEGGKKFQPDDVEDKLAKQSGIKEIGLLKKDHKLVALVVPNLKDTGDKDVKEAISASLKSAATQMASYLHITDFALTRQPLPRTNLGKLKRHELEKKYDQAKAEEKSGGDKKVVSDADFSPEDKALINNPAAGACWDWLKKRFPDHSLTLDTSPELELNIDSLEWMNLTLEIVESTGVEISGDALTRVNTVRDLLNEIADAAEHGGTAASPIKHPERFLDAESQQYIEPLTKDQEAAAKRMHELILLLMKPFPVEAVNYKNVPEGQVVFTPNHASYIDAFALTAAIPLERLRHTQIAGWIGIAFANPLFAYLSRLAQVFPIDADRSMLTSLALGAAVLKGGKSLIWFPEAKRTLDGELLPFKQGIGILLKDTEIPVVPVLLSGTREALKPGAVFPTFTKMKVIFGEAILPAQLEKEGEGDSPQERIASALKARVQKLKDGNVSFEH